MLAVISLQDFRLFVLGMLKIQTRLMRRVCLSLGVGSWLRLEAPEPQLPSVNLDKLLSHQCSFEPDRRFDVWFRQAAG